MNNNLAYTLFVICLMAIFLWSPSQFTMAQQPRPQQIKGVVVDANTKEPLVGVTVQTPHSGMATNLEGWFHVIAIEGEEITFSYVGYKTHKHPVKANQKELRIELMENATELESVVVQAGIMQREKMGFTGAYNTINKEELKAIGNTNILQSLKSLDPSFVQIENNLSGSNPNMLGSFEIRGQTTMAITSVQNAANTTSSANMPLFLLDGFEVSLQQVNDLDINRVESITILKDAGSTAIYGSRGANGIVVIETIKPKSDEIIVSYSGNFQLAAADLSAYNMMNAREKLEFELKAGRFGTIDPPSTTGHQEEYFKRLAIVAQGRDTYWLSEPIRVAFSQQHSASISGGAERIMFSAGLGYNGTTGVMKGSDRRSYDANLNLIYRGLDNLNISNNVFVQGTNSDDGTYGSFADYVNASPYALKYNADGSIPKYADDFPNRESPANPLYHASLFSYGRNDVFNLTNNTSVEWRINPEFMIRSTLNLGYTNSKGTNFLDPRHKRFDSVTYDKKGTYNAANTKSWKYDFSVNVNYAKSFDMHNFVLHGRYNILQNTSGRDAYELVGFPEGVRGYPSYATGFTPNKKLDYNESTTRMLSVVGAFNYNYNYRYLLDINYNVDGTTNFGAKKRFHSFWSAGVGWNVQREAFAKDWDWLDNLKLRSTYGINGNQNTTFRNNSIYTYAPGNTLFGQTAELSSVGNPNLKWQVVKKLSAGFDLEVFKRLSLQFDVYRNLTDPQLINIGQRASSGVSSYDMNMGYLQTQGMDFIVSYRLINKRNLFWSVRATGAVISSKYGGFNDALDELNQTYKTTQKEVGGQTITIGAENGGKTSLETLRNYEDGRSPFDIWAVRSLGVDPSTGVEIFLDKDGNPTKFYNVSDRVVVGSSRPTIEGVFGTTLRYKKLTFNATIRYSVGGYAYNSALFTKVENISQGSLLYNQDKRALYDRWQKPGDRTAFIAINALDQVTPVSSRFVQKNNYLRGEAFKLQWNFTGDKWLKYLHIADCTASISMQDVFNLSSTRMERGINYPYQRAVSMNISARF